MHHQFIENVRAGLHRHQQETMAAIQVMERIQLGTGVGQLQVGPGAVMAYSRRLTNAVQFTGSSIDTITMLLYRTKNDELLSLQNDLIEFDHAARQALAKSREVARFINSRDAYLKAV